MTTYNNIRSFTPPATPQKLLKFIQDDARDGMLSIRGVAKLAGVADTSIIRGGAVASAKLAQTLFQYGFEPAALVQDSFPPQAVIR